MDEIKFVFKCLLFSCAVVLFSQITYNNKTVEGHITQFLTTSSTAHFVRQSALGGAELIRVGYYKTQRLINEKMGKSSQDSDFKESQQASVITRPIYSQSANANEPRRSSQTQKAFEKLKNLEGSIEGSFKEKSSNEPLLETAE